MKTLKDILKELEQLSKLYSWHKMHSLNGFDSLEDEMNTFIIIRFTEFAEGLKMEIAKIKEYKHGELFDKVINKAMEAPSIRLALNHSLHGTHNQAVEELNSKIDKVIN